MYSRIAAFVLITALAGFAQEIHLKTQTIQPDSTAISTIQPADLPGVHRIVQFDHFPSVEDLDTLLADGNVVLGVVPDNAVVVTAQTGSVTVRPGMSWIAPLNPADKLSPVLGNAAAISAVVEFHADVPQSAQEAVFAAEGMTSLRPAALMANHAIVMASPGGLTALAAHDEVAYIFPADPGLLNGGDLYPCIGMLTTAGPVAQYANIVHGWDLDSANAAHLGYVFGALTPNVAAATVKSEIVRALNEWSKITNVIFQAGTSATAPRTVLVEFASGAHGDAYPFEGSTGVIAHTFYPVPVNPESIAGDMHLNADVPWHVGSNMDIYSVALHEAGHAIGLGHSDNPGDVMYPYYRTNMALSANDIGAARALYGVPGAVSVISANPVITTTATGGASVAALPTPLQLTLNAVPSSTASGEASITGTISGGTPPFTVQWQTNHGYSGVASVASAAWIANAVTLVNGSNTVSVTAFDAAHQTASQTATITLIPPPAVTVSSVPVTVAITSPTSVEVTVSTATISLTGTASGGAGVTRVTWETCGGVTGTATGTGHWTASAIPLLEGTNTIMVRAYDSKGANGWTVQIAVRH
jgi:hypothetical protein